MKWIEFNIIIVLPVFFTATAYSQASDPVITIGLFNTISKDFKITSDPFISGTIGDYYFENRYNYEAENSASINIGKTVFKKLKNIYIIPMVGIVMGSFKGITAELQTILDNKRWYVSTDNQLSVEWKEGKQNFFFNWSIVRYKITPSFRIGVSTLFAKPFTSKQNFEQGLTASLKIKNYGLNFYAFNYDAEKRHYLLSLCYTFKLTSKK